MKLIFCKNCGDVFNLTKELKKCSCGKSFGKYVDGLNAEISRESTPIGFQNSSFVLGLHNIPGTGKGKEFTAFFIPRICPTIRRIK